METRFRVIVNHHGDSWIYPKAHVPPGHNVTGAATAGENCPKEGAILKCRVEREGKTHPTHRIKEACDIGK